MFVTFFHELKAAKVPVTLKEYLSLMQALEADLAEKRVEDFYFLSRTCHVKDERHLDTFDQRIGDRVDVDGRRPGRSRDVSAPVDEHERTLEAHAAELQHRFTRRAEDAGVVGIEGGTGKAGRRIRRLAGQQRGYLSNDLDDVEPARQLDVLRGDRLHGDRGPPIRVP